jgi:hypothetical protein
MLIAQPTDALHTAPCPDEYSRSYRNEMRTDPRTTTLHHVAPPYTRIRLPTHLVGKVAHTIADHLFSAKIKIL